MRAAVLTLAVALLLLPVPATAHPGGLNGAGCHHDRVRGGYHCHEARAPGAGGQVRGTASVIDGDTLDIHGQRIRLHGIDAPEARQLCQRRDGQPLRCGQAAALALSDFIARRPVSCDVRDTDRYGRAVAVCTAGGTDINRWMVAGGHALAYRRYSTDYVGDEDAARAARRGVWATEFEVPWEWRRRGR